MELLSTIGHIVRPLPGTEAQEVTLTATISKGEEQITQDFSFKVKPLTDDEVVSKNAGNLTPESLLGDNVSANTIIKDIVLPSEGIDGAKITWKSSNDGVLSSKGKVNRPKFSQGNITVTLTATIKSREVSSEKEIKLTVVKLAQTEEELVDSVFEQLSKTVLNSNPDSSHISSSLYFPSTISGVNIKYQSNNTRYISSNGTVSRPSSSQGNTSVTVTIEFSIQGKDKKFNRTMNFNVLAED